MSAIAPGMILIAYLCGSISSAILVCRLCGLPDPRTSGSGNPGATNVLRIGGKGAAVAVLIFDVLKGMLPVWGAYELGVSPFWLGLIAIAACLGHIWPVFFGFKGGKGVATSLGILLMTNWQIGLICLVFALVLMILTRMVSLGSCMAAVLFPILTLFIRENYIVSEGSSYFIYSVILALIVLYNHRSNIKRILNGTENKLSFKK